MTHSTNRKALAAAAFLAVIAVTQAGQAQAGWTCQIVGTSVYSDISPTSARNGALARLSQKLLYYVRLGYVKQRSQIKSRCRPDASGWSCKSYTRMCKRA